MIIIIKINEIDLSFKFNEIITFPASFHLYVETAA